VKEKARRKVLIRVLRLRIFDHTTFAAMMKDWLID